MTESDWSRPHWTRAEAKALLVYFVFGTFDADIQAALPARVRDTLPREIEVRRIPRAMLAHWEGHPLRGALGETFRAADPDAFAAARAAPECLMLRGEFADRASLAYLRDTLGVVAALLDAGGSVVVDPQILEILNAAAWRQRYAAGALAEPRSHVLVLCHDAAGGAAWIKTRGMRKFARPDVSIRAVPREDVQRAGVVAAKLVELQARGMRFGDGSVVDAGAAGKLAVTRAGTLDDPEFNNTHLEVAWPQHAGG
ncbi:MAG TPA: hypothetical protein VF292_12815 [Rhodanobacteraceae bacterium]